MPLKARFEIFLYVLAALCVLASALAVLVWTEAPGWVTTILLVTFALAWLLALDAFYPKVNLFGPAVVRLGGRNGPATQVALTFDDGPVSPYTEQILDILDGHGVKGSFFCIGENVERNPEIAKAIVSRGHTLGNHTASHRNLMFAGPAEVMKEVSEAQRMIFDATGQSPRFFRCPKGYKSPVVVRCLRRLDLTLVGYGYPIFDVENPPAQELVARVLNRVRGGDIIVMHDGYPPHGSGRRDSLVAALPAIIEGIRDRGLALVSLEEAINS